MNIKKLAVIGAGQMGSGIAQVVASKGIEVVLIDTNNKALENGFESISKSCDRIIKKEKMTEQEKKVILSKIKITTQLEDTKSVDFVIEAVSEKFDIKQEVFRRLDQYCPSHAILCSNTSSISITKIAASTNRPENVAGMHFMNPVPLMKLVEGIRGLQTSQSTFDAVKVLSKALDKVFVESLKDMPGFVVNRILMPMINEAIYTFHEGIAEVKDIDGAMMLGTNQPIGPLALADFIGLDICLSIMEVIHDGLGDSKYRPCPLLIKYVEAGWLGRKSGKGFYTYDTK